jgi:outer membrane protein TolC
MSLNLSDMNNPLPARFSMKQMLMSKIFYRALVAGGILTMLFTTSDLLSRELTLDDAIDVALNRTARGEMIRGNLEVAEQNYFARKINFYLPEISINGAVPAYSVDESYRLFGGASKSGLFKTRDLGFRSFIELRQSLITGGDVTVTANLTAQDYRYPNTGPDATVTPFINQETRLGDFNFSYTQPLLKASESKFTLRNTKDDFLTAEIVRIEDEAALKKEVIETYLGVLQMSLQSELYDNKFESASLKSEIDSSKLLDGVISEEDWLLSASGRLDAELDKFEKDNESNEKKRELAILLDLDATEEMSLAEPQLVSPLDDDSKQRILDSWESSAPVIKAEIDYSRQKRLADYAASGHGLSGDLTANFSTGQGRVDVDGARDDINTKGWGISLNFSLPLWDGGSSGAAVKAAHLGAEQAKLEYNRTKRSTRAEIINLVNQLDVSYRRLEIIRQQIDLAKNKLDIAKERYDDGQISKITYLESKVFYLETKDKYLEELKSYLLNRVELDSKFIGG